MSEIIRLGSSKVKKKWAGIGEQLKRLESMPLPIRILASPKTTAVLGTTLAALTGGAALVPAKLWTGTKILGGVALGEGLIQSSPKIESFAKRKLQPEKVGKYLGEQVEGFGKEKENGLTWKEKAKEGLKKAGLIGGAVALAGAGALGLSKAIPFVKKKLAEKKQREVGLIKNDLGRAPITLRQPYVPLPSAVPLSMSPIQAPQSQLKHQPIQNIIQIQVR